MEAVILISPSEPVSIREHGKTSSIPEMYGADILMAVKGFGMVGIQRKDISDLIASLHDDRLYTGLAKMKALELGVVIIEGRLSWTEDGNLVSRHQWTEDQHHGLVWSIEAAGYKVAHTANPDDTIKWCRQFNRWMAKSKHTSLRSRPKPVTNWGFRDNRDWGIFLLQSFEGIGPELAGAIFDHFHGVPLRWLSTEEEFMLIPGIGKGRARKLIEALR